MRQLRNKKTGTIWEIPKMRHPTVQEYGISFYAQYRQAWRLFSYKSLADLNAEWEDYEPEEPKITDPEWRHVVREWHKLNGLEEELKVSIAAKNYMIIGWRKDEGEHGQEIDIPLSAMECGEHFFDEIRYTITELCGEEEAPEPIEPTFIDLDERIKGKEEKPRPVIANGVEYDSYADYLKSREEEG